MKSYQVDNLTITLDKEGSSEFLKVSYPIRCGRFAEIETPDYIFQFNLNGEIKHIQGRNRNWPHPAEWMKRTVGNDWSITRPAITGALSIFSGNIISRVSLIRATRSW